MQQLTERMKAMLGPFVLRRLKTEVASQLTAKQQKVEMVGMTDSQAELYQKAVQDLKTQVGAPAKGVLSACISRFLFGLPCTAVASSASHCSSTLLAPANST